MKEATITDRLAFLAEQFDVFECGTEENTLETKINELKEVGLEPYVIHTPSGVVIGIVSTKLNEKGRTLKKISICSDVFASMVIADPTENKIYLQWMLNVFGRLIKSGENQDLASAIRFVDEDLPQANTYLMLFEDNKRKRKFIELCKSSYSLIHVSDPTNINQYKSLAQLFDAVDPFIEREPSAVERTLYKFVDSGQAEIPVKDRKFTLYIPKTTSASVVFDKFANWCTAREGNGMFKSYTEGHKKPNGKNSDIYIIINNKFFKGESEDLFQIHFETNQLKDRKNSSNVSIFESVLMESEGLLNFFHDELITMAKQYKKGLETNKYLDYLIQFGFSDSLFELYSDDIPSIRIMNREVPKIADMTRFKNLDQLIVINAKLVELHPSVCSLGKLELLSLTNNRLKTLPREIGSLKNLEFINIIGNPIKEIPTEISYLDKSNGGKLHRLAVKEEEIGTENYLKLKKLLPQTNFD
jgi:hypothetical protein